MKKSLVLLGLVAILTSNAFSLETKSVEIDTPLIIDEKKVFGHNLFQNKFELNNKFYNDPNYKVSKGDTVSVKLWGAISSENDLIVDKKGNIFIANIGVVPVIGLNGSLLNSTIEKHIKNVYKNNVFVYSSIKTYQEVNVFVAGSVVKPGLYNGLSADSVLRFLDLAAGINVKSGSFRNIDILRNNKVIRNIDLYSFLVSGQIESFQFHSGDVILVHNAGNRVFVDGDVARPYIFELKKSIPLEKLVALASPDVGTNFVSIERSQDNKTEFEGHSLSQGGVYISGGDKISFSKNYHNTNLQLTVSGEHDGAHKIVLKRGSSLQDVVDVVKTNGSSDIKDVIIYRKSVAELHKKMLKRQLTDLQKQVLTKQPSSESSKTDALSTNHILEFIEKAKKIEPKGLISINEETSLSEMLLEDGDEIFIPRKTNIILTQGEVSIPGAHTWIKGQTANDYIDMSGGLSERHADGAIIIKQNGLVLRQDFGVFASDVTIEPGDSVVVFADIKSSNMDIVKGLSTILYNLAVTTKVVLSL